MLSLLATTGRVLLRHGPRLLAWFLAGWLGRYAAIQLAALVGAYWTVGGLLLLPLAVLVRLISFVAMFLAVRDALHELGVIAERPATAAGRRAAFMQSLLAGILPFFAVYAAWGFLKDDTLDYARRALEIQTELILESVGKTVQTQDVTIVGFGPWTIAVVSIAFGLRWAWKRWEAKLPRVLSLGAVYLEAVWIFFFVWTLGDLTRGLSDWVSHRAAMVWLGEVHTWIGERIAVLAWIWDSIVWAVGQLGGILLQPLAWLAVAGVIYGQAIAVERVPVPSRWIGNTYVTTVRRRYAAVPSWARTRVADVGAEFAGRFRPIGRSLLLMWHAGPVVIGGYVLLYSAVLAMQGFLPGVIVRLIGPHDLGTFWAAFATPIFLLVPLVVEPLRIAVVAASYDSTLGALRRRAAGAALEKATAEGASPQEAAAEAVLQADGSSTRSFLRSPTRRSSRIRSLRDRRRTAGTTPPRWCPADPPSRVRARPAVQRRRRSSGRPTRRPGTGSVRFGCTPHRALASSPPTPAPCAAR